MIEWNLNHPKLPLHEIPILSAPTFDEIGSRYGDICQGLVTFCRKPHVELNYQRYRKELASRGKMPADIIRAEAGESPIWITDNLFPYCMKGVRHFVLFLLDDSVCLDMAREHLHAWAEKMEIPVEDLIVFQNPHELQSMNSVPHWHVMVRGNMSPE